MAPSRGSSDLHEASKRWSATATIKGFEIMRMIRRGRCLTCRQGVHNEIRFVNRLFQVAA